MFQREGLTNVLSPVLAAGWSRRFLSRILPIPEQVFTTGADTYWIRDTGRC
jgi:hypothetical protein